MAAVLVSFAAIAMATAYFRVQFPSEPTSDEFAVYGAFLSHLSTDWPRHVGHSSPDRFALANRTSELGEPYHNERIPAELQPYPPEKAEPPESVIAFCGWLCGRDFMRKNLRSWQLKPERKEQFAFEILAVSIAATTTERGVRIVTVSRSGFDLWHQRAVLNYFFDCGHDGSLDQEAFMCGESGQALLEKVNNVCRCGATPASCSERVVGEKSQLHSSYERGCQAKTLLHCSP
jgi:hypothetical protein